MDNTAPIKAQIEAHLKAEIEAVKKENGQIKLEFTTLANTQLNDTKWTDFVSKVNAASSKIDQVTQSLEAYKKSKAPISEDPNANFFEEYAKLYERIKTALMEGDKLKSDLNSNYDNLVEAIKGDDLNIPIYSFIEAIKSNSLNSKAKKIKAFEGNDTEINYRLLTAVLTNLNPDIIKQVGLPEQIASLDQLLGKVVEMLNTSNSDLSKRISESYNQSVSSQGGGSFSSSMSKKNRKSHKSYHPGIGKTKKHHHGHHNKISFVH